jgi:hypothetical protein
MVMKNRGPVIKEEGREGCNMFFGSEQGGMQLPFCTKKSLQQSNMHVHGLLTFGKDSFNVKHQITEIRFGAHFPGVF